MKDITFKPDEYCLFPNEELNSILDLLRENGYIAGMLSMHGHDAIKYDGYKLYSVFSHKIIERENSKELSRSEFIYKATRGKGAQTSAENAPVEFDSSLPFEVSEDGEQWERLNLHYIGFNELSSVHVLADLTFGPDCYVMYDHIRNIPEFTASMLEVGECMECETGQDGKKNILKRISNEKWICIRHGIDTIDAFTANQIKGRRVRVNITTEEV